MPRDDLDAFVEDLAARARALREELMRAGGSRASAIAGLGGAPWPAKDAAPGTEDAVAANAAHAAAQLFAYGALCARWFEVHEGGGAGLSLLCDRLGGNRQAVLLFERVGTAAGGLDAARAIAALVGAADLDALFGAGHDAALAHSYERFLGAYDADLRRARGVYFTPAPVAAFVVRRVDRVLGEDIGLDLGLAAPVDATGAPVHVLDPACGTGAFLAAVVRLVHRAFVARRASGRAASAATAASDAAAWRAHVREALLPRLHGIEVMPTSYAVCQAHLALALAATGYRLASDDVLDVRLADALAQGGAFAPSAAVILMNPPYRRGARARASGSAPLAPDDSLAAYREGLDGERNLQPLSDDHVRFVRLAQLQVAGRPWGVVGMVGNSTFLSGRLYRGMRGSLGRTFDAVEVVDLHGSARKGRAAPGTPRDENVFDVGQGVAVVVMRRGGASSQDAPRVDYAELRGSRAQKQHALAADTVPAAVPVRPRAPYHLWVPAAEAPDEYAAFLPLDALFSFHSVGGKPGNDAVLVGFDPDEVLSQLQKVRASLDSGANEAAQKLARRPVDAPFERARVAPYAYRPFDTRYVYDEPAIWTRPVPALRRRLDGEPLLLTSRVVNDHAFAHVFASRILPDVILLSPTSSVNCHAFPASAIVVEPVERALGRAVPPRALFAYAYAILHSPAYRVRYAPALALDYPRIPLVGKATLFDGLAALGAELLALHLMDADVALEPSELPRFVDGGDRRVTQAGNPRGGGLTDTTDDAGKLYVNAVSYFDPVPIASWQHRIGGYQVLRKWLLDRKRAGRTLSDADIAHYRRVVASVGRSLAIAGRIDACIAEHGGWPAAFIDAVRVERT